MAISLVTYGGQDVTSQDDALIYKAASLKSGIICGAALTQTTLEGAPAITIADGHGVIAGRKITIESETLALGMSAGNPCAGLVIRLNMSADLTTATVSDMVLVAPTIAELAVIQDDDININGGYYDILLATFKGSSSTVTEFNDLSPKIGLVSKTLTAGSTTITFYTSLFEDTCVDFISSTGVEYTNIDTTISGQVTLTYEAQASDITIYMESKEA